jgi:hypothetical protein
MLHLPQADGTLLRWQPSVSPIRPRAPARPFTRIAFAAAHVVADPLAPRSPWDGRPAIDWEATLRFRHWLWDQGFGLAEVMDTAQRGMGLDWETARELVGRTMAEARAHPARPRVACGAGTDQHELRDLTDLGRIEAAYRAQIEAIEGAGAQAIVMATRALPAIGAGPADYAGLYRRLIAAADRPVILHWLGEMFDPALAGYWGTTDRAAATETVLGIINADPGRVDGIKVSLLDRAHEEDLRARLPAGVRLYTGDDYNYPELIAGDGRHHSDALLGIFAAIAPAAAQALEALAGGDLGRYHALMGPTVPLAHEIFAPPTRFYKAGVAFLAWINGLQRQFAMPAGMQSARGIVHYARLLQLADAAGLVLDGDLAVARMRALLTLNGIEAA